MLLGGGGDPSFERGSTSLVTIVLGCCSRLQVCKEKWHEKLGDIVGRLAL